MGGKATLTLQPGEGLRELKTAIRKTFGKYEYHKLSKLTLGAGATAATKNHLVDGANVTCHCAPAPATTAGPTRAPCRDPNHLHPPRPEPTCTRRDPNPPVPAASASQPKRGHMKALLRHAPGREAHIRRAVKHTSGTPGRPTKLEWCAPNPPSSWQTRTRRATRAPLVAAASAAAAAAARVALVSVAALVAVRPAGIEPQETAEHRVDGLRPA
eukprot:3861822-Prymnesium_polylepis.1